MSSTKTLTAPVAVAAAPLFDPDVMLRVTEAARRMGISRSTTYALMDAGKIAYHKIGGSRRLRGADLNVFVESTRQG